MGGTMDWPRLRNRNGLNHRKMEGDPGYGTMELLDAEMNRLEQSMMGVYADLGDIEAEKCVRGAGVSMPEAKRVLRWFLGLPEPGCAECEKYAGYNPVYQRCPKHQGSEWA